MIQDLGAHCYHNEYIPVPPTEQDFILCYNAKTVLVRKQKTAFYCLVSATFQIGKASLTSIYFPLMSSIFTCFQSWSLLFYLILLLKI